MNTTHPDIRGLLEFAATLADLARTTILNRSGTSFAVSQKTDRSFVTEVDTQVEEMLRDRIAQAYPEHGILGEELPTRNPDAELRWILDPIDGTVSFMHGIPLFGTLLALEHREETILGVIDLPAIDRRLVAGKGLGALVNGKPICLEDVASDEKIEDEIIATSDRANFLRSGREQQLRALQDAHPRVRTYSDCFGHALAVLGAVGAMVDFSICRWDMAATKILVEEAGGKLEIVEQIDKPDTPTRYSIIAGRPRVVSWLSSFFPAQVESR